MPRTSCGSFSSVGWTPASSETETHRVVIDPLVPVRVRFQLSRWG